MRVGKNSVRVCAGICTQCREPVVTGNRMCQIHLDRNAAYARARRLTSNINGVCWICSQPTDQGKSCCKKHNEDGLLRSRKMRSKRIGNKLCTQCKSINTTGYYLCRDCSQRIEIEKAERTAAGLCLRIGCPNDVAPGRKQCKRCLDNSAESSRKAKQVVFNHYGQICNCPCGCRVTNYRWLTIDHINNDGAEKRKRGGHRAGKEFYLQIARLGFPDDLQILCWNCNCAKAFFGGCQ